MQSATRIFAGRISDFDLRLIQTFRAVADCGGFALAEVELRMTKSAISKQISDLEVRLGIQLCHRGRAGFSLTAEGQTVYKASTRLFNEIDVFKAELASQRHEPAGVLFIGCIDNLVTSHCAAIIDILKQFSDAYPRVDLKLVTASAAEIEQSVASKRLHIGFCAKHRQVDGIDSLPLFSEASSLYCAIGHPLFDVADADLTVADVNAQRFVQHAYSETELRREQSVPLSPSANSQFTEGIAMLILTGNFVGFLPEHYARAWVIAGRMRPLLPDQIRKDSSIHMLYAGEAQSLPLVSAFVDMARSKQGQITVPP